MEAVKVDSSVYLCCCRQSDWWFPQFVERTWKNFENIRLIKILQTSKLQRFDSNRPVYVEKYLQREYVLCKKGSFRERLFGLPRLYLPDETSASRTVQWKVKSPYARETTSRHSGNIHEYQPTLSQKTFAR